jgi:hypothetical protein
MQVHYNQLNGRGLPDQTAMDLYFSPTPVRRVAQLVPALQTNLRIPAGSANAEATAEFNLRRLGVPLSVTVYGSFPHMHMLGRQLQVESTAMDGTRTCLMNTPDWNFHWQQFYFYEEPVRITPDDTIRIRCRYDNSAANQPVVDGVQQTPREVRWGEGSLDEMCLNFFYVTIP